jgi:hypothetical protein
MFGEIADVLSGDFIWLPFAVLALSLVYMSQIPKGEYRVGLVNLLAVLLGGVLVVVCTNAVFNRMDLERSSAIVRQKWYVPEGANKAPVMMLIGSSYTRNGINPEIVNKIWAAENIHTRLMTRAAGGASRLEQWILLEDAQKALGRMPEKIMFEIHPQWDAFPLYGLKNPMSSRAINQITDSTLRWAFLAVFYDDRFAAQWKTYPTGLNAVAEIVKHYLAGKVNFGLAQKQNMIVHASARPRSAFRPLAMPKASVDLAKLRQRLATPTPYDETAPSLSESNPWLDVYFSDVKSRIEAAGGRLTGYYSLPNSLPNFRGYTRQFCAWKADSYCLNANLPDVFRDYGSVDMWYDYTHLLDKGAELFSVWFAYRLIKDKVVS